MAVNDIYQLQVHQVMAGGEQALNVFYYRVLDGDNSAADLNSTFADDLWDFVRLMQTAGTITTLYRCINGMDNDDYQDSGASDAGLSGGTEITARFNAAGFRSPKGSPGKRYSYKRFAGIPIGYFGTTDGSWPAVAETPLIAIQNVLGVVLEGDDASYQPVQVTGGFAPGVTPTFSRTLQGQWTTCIYPVSQVSRKELDWQVLS